MSPGDSDLNEVLKNKFFQNYHSFILMDSLIKSHSNSILYFKDQE